MASASEYVLSSSISILLDNLCAFVCVKDRDRQSKREGGERGRERGERERERVRLCVV